MAAKPKTEKPTGHTRRSRGFERTSSLIQPHLQGAGEKRGFAVARLLTHWADIVGAETARIAHPVKIGYGRQGFGATLTVLTTGANAPMLQAEEPKIRARVNACYGYNAISRIRITQTAPEGFAEAQAAFAGATPAAAPAAPSPQIRQAAHETAEGVHDEGLRSALEALARNVLTRNTQ
ncbi:DUF721 domain-containing protein [Maritimibacter sp. 55A14]|uniref:DUF721 domain-containing protein n=1 Tax=Maritimibacter sp. 55A14 TaxID=2174844 RepID=UPI000D61BEBF|nr:DciA family protein [Maritimibacter sp. 55A14]PWE32631.1 DUF721 domain-containing protein [Maritimibacter sp. 55A14]